MSRALLQFLARFVTYLLVIAALAWLAQSLWFHSLPRTQLSVGTHPLRATVAETPRSRAWGLMLRLGLSEDEGMLFVYQRPRKVCMWMMNTFIPLSVAFVDETGAIAGVDDMAPLTRRRHCSPHAVKYALEVPQGWLTDHGVTTGAVVAGLPPSGR